MTRETKIGLMMVAVVVGVFGFLIYKRLHRPMEGFAEQTREEIRKPADDRVSDQFDDPEPPRQLPPAFKKREREGAREIQQVSNTVDEFTQNVLEDIAPAPKPRKKPALPADLDAKDDDFAQFIEPRKPRAEPRRIQNPDPVDDAFDVDRQPTMQPPQMKVSNADSDEADPFSTDLTDAKVKPVQFEERPHRDRSTTATDDFEERPATRDSRSTYATSDFENRAEEPRRVEDFGNRPESPALARRRPAPGTIVDDHPSDARLFQRKPGTDAGVVSRDPELRAAVSGDGKSYEIQPNDNFWSISRKIYGAGRYYKALAAHNQQTIPDPKMMRPGVVIATPDVTVLEQRYADLIPKAAPSDSVTSVSTTQSRKPVETDPSGYFVSGDGMPMYRVGENDTLTGIAKSHLGRTSRWVQILEMNRNVLRDGNELKIGTVLRLPADASRVQVVGSAREYR